MLPSYEQVWRAVARTEAWENLNRQRSKYRLLRIIWTVIGAILTLAALSATIYALTLDSSGGSDEEGGAFYVIFLVIIILVLGPYFIWRGNKRLEKKYSAYYKKTVVPQLIDTMLLEASPMLGNKQTKNVCSYQAEGMVDREQLLDLPPFSSLAHASRWKGEDLLVGNQGTVSYQMAEVSAWEKREEEDRTTHEQIFNGLVLLADIEPPVDGTLTLFSKTTRTILAKPASPQISLGNVTFDEAFTVWGDNEQLAHKLLNTEMQDHLVALSEHFSKKPISLCWHNKKLAIAIEKIDLFESQGIQPISPEIIEHTYEEIKLVLGIIQLFDPEVPVRSEQLYS